MKRTVVLDPHPRTRELIFSKADFRRLQSIASIHECRQGKMPAAELATILPSASAIIGQTDLPRQRLESATKLKAIINVEGNFQQNIDYAYCFNKGIHVLNAGIAFSQAVAEMSLGFALCLGRGLADADRRFRSGREVYGAKSNTASFLLRRKNVGIIGLGNIGRTVAGLLQPFDCRIQVFDPWLPENYITELGLVSNSLEELLKLSRVIFVLAGATSENQAMLGRTELELIGEDALLILVSRASVVDFEALTDLLAAGRFRAAIDVFPQEPLPEQHRLRGLDNVLLSSHRAGSLQEAYKLMGKMTVDDLSLIFQGLAPVRLQRADWETVTKMSSKPVKG